MSVLDLTDSVQALPEALVLGIDTEFFDTDTLTIQVAARLSPDTVAVQLYRSPTIPDLPANLELQHYLPTTSDKYGRFFQRLNLLPVKLLSPWLSPMRMVQDLFDIPELRILSRADGEQTIETFDSELNGFSTEPPANVAWNPRRKRWDVPSLHLTLVGLFLRADFGRLFGWKFYDNLKKIHYHGRPQINIEGRKLLRFIEQHGRRSDTKPILEYVYQGRTFHAVRVEMFDTMLTFGPASLDRLSRTFLGLPKCTALDEEDKKDMRRVFATRPADAYGYAIRDVVNTLLVHEQMVEKDREIYRAFHFAEENIPRLQPFQGRRVSTFLLAATRATVADGSEELKRKTSLRSLLRSGGLALFQDHPELSKFGDQAGRVHGGLLFSRSPAQLWHEAKGMLADMDMAGCYVQNASCINVYWGRPVVFEPGSRSMTVAEAVAFVRQLAPDDGWVLFASGPIRDYFNALIPSTEDAVTSANYRCKKRSQRRQTTRQTFFWEATRDPDAARSRWGARLYTGQVDYGIVTHSTWLMIQALPAQARKQYEQLVVDSIVFYPSLLIAEDGPHYDALVEQYSRDALPWQTIFDTEKMELIERQKIDADYVSLRFPLGGYCQQFAAFRKMAQETEGKNSGLDLAWKQQGNTVYGVLASPHHIVNNVVAANIITAMARARAFALSQALNAIQTITDGCTYRRDQIPTLTYTACVRRQPDYPIHRAESNGRIPFTDATTIPIAEDGFSAWYAEYAKRFFEVEGPEYTAFFSSHVLSHKRTEQSQAATFDALACDGAGNYVKATLTETGSYQIEDCKARGYGKESKTALQAWLLEVYRTDTLTELPPLTEDRELLSLLRACREAKVLLEDGLTLVYLPLGLACTKVMNYRIIKASAFLFETPRQRQAMLKQMRKFEEKTGCGLEVLAMRRSYQDRRQGSLTDLLRVIETAIRQGKTNLTAVLNLGRATDQVALHSTQRQDEIEKRKAQARANLRLRIDLSPWIWVGREPYPTALLVTPEDLAHLRQDGQMQLGEGTPEIPLTPR